tara:strand:+ start:1762 stop:2112 length:351 start_codon:yes stop_codon:yes gene_type:complete
MVTKIFRFHNKFLKTKYCDVYISVTKKKGKKRSKYFVNIDFIYSDESIDSTKANPLYMEGINREDLIYEKYKLKCNDFNHGLVDYLLMDFNKLSYYSGYKSAHEYKKELIQFLILD